MIFVISLNAQSHSARFPAALYLQHKTKDHLYPWHSSLKFLAPCCNGPSQVTYRECAMHGKGRRAPFNRHSNTSCVLTFFSAWNWFMNSSQGTPIWTELQYLGYCLWWGRSTAYIKRCACVYFGNSYSVGNYKCCLSNCARTDFSHPNSIPLSNPFDGALPSTRFHWSCFHCR